jgi:hypothetical protein
LTRYAAVFWERGAAAFPPAEWERIVKAVEKVCASFSLLYILILYFNRERSDLKRSLD